MYQGKIKDIKENYTSPRGSGSRPYPPKGIDYRQNTTQNSKNFYCIFCESAGHSTGWCKIRKYNRAYKEGKCLKHNCCFSCLKTTDHKSDTCPYRRECGICRRFHHFNLHPRDDVIKYYQNKRKQ